MEKLARSLNMKLVKTSVKENLNVGKVRPARQIIHIKLIKIWDFVVICTVYNTFTVLGTKPGTKIALAVWMAKIELPHIPN